MSNQTHVSYEVSKKLKEFMGDSAPEPMDRYPMYISGFGSRVTTDKAGNYTDMEKYPAYQLHDLLSKPFCEAMAYCIGLNRTDVFDDIVFALTSWGGLPAVEKALLEMMEGK